MDREAIGDCIGLDATNDPQGLRLAHIVFNLERRLASYSAKLARVGNYPLPSNLIAELKPIEKALAELSKRLHPDQITPHALAAIAEASGGPVSVVGLWDSLTNLHSNARDALAALGKCSSSRGLPRSIRAGFLDQVDECLSRYFNSVAKDADTDDREAFLKVCRKYVKASPSPLPQVAPSDTAELPFDGEATIEIDEVITTLTQDG